ncbi:hypothetical protein DXT66_02645 [Nocardia farcinica]|nr:hypothetical protein DXT66_02645 [Nocardia farcinica]
MRTREHTQGVERRLQQIPGAGREPRLGRGGHGRGSERACGQRGCGGSGGHDERGADDGRGQRAPDTSGCGIRSHAARLCAREPQATRRRFWGPSIQ